MDLPGLAFLVGHQYMVVCGCSSLLAALYTIRHVDHELGSKMWQ